MGRPNRIEKLFHIIAISGNIGIQVSDLWENYKEINEQLTAQGMGLA